MNTSKTLPLRVALVLLLLGLLLIQVLVPIVATDVGLGSPEVAYLVFPYSVLGILSILAVQIAVVTVWVLLTMVGNGRIFTDRALPRVDAVTICLAVATLLSCGVMIHVLFYVGVGGPGVVLSLGACLIGGIALVLLMTVMRSLLAAAIANRAELDQVI